MRTSIIVLIAIGLGALIAMAAPAGKAGQWEPVGLSGYGGLFSPAISPADPKLMMIHCDMSAAYISRDGGRSWKMIHHSQLRTSTVCRPAFHPTDPKVIFSAQSGGGMKVSRDAGETWEAIRGTPDNLTGEIAIDPGQPDHMLAGDRNGIAISTDGGKKWSACHGPKGQTIAFHFDQTSPANSRVCFAATSEGIWRSDDGGRTWTAKTHGLPSTDIKAFSGGSSAKSKTAILYCSVTSKAEGGQLVGGVFMSRDRGEKWESAMGDGINKDTKAADEWAMGPVPQYISLATTDANPSIVWAFNTNTGVRPPHHTAFYRSDNAGKTWRPTFCPDPRFKEYNCEPEIVAVCDGQYYQGPMQAAIDNKNPDHVMLIGTEVFYTEDGGKSWRCGNIQKAGENRGDTFWKCSGLVVTTTWNYYVDPCEHSRHYIAYTDIGFARSLDAGKTWAWWEAKNQPPWKNTCYELAFEPKTPGKIWGAFSNTHDIPNYNIIGGGHSDRPPGGVCVSTDAGKSWKKSNQGLPDKPCLSVVMDPKTQPGQRTLYASMFNAGVFKSVDDGKTWAKASDGLGDPKNMRTCRMVLHEDGTLFVLITAMRSGGQFMKEGVGLWRSKDGAKTWEQINKSASWLWPKDFTVDPKDSRVIYVGACNAGGGAEQAGLYRTTDGGGKWNRLAKEGPQHFGAYLHHKRPGWIYMTLTEGAPGAGLWLSKDNGQSFKPMKGLPFSNAQRVTVDPDDPNVIYVSTFGGSVWRGPAGEE
jgi:photosystem II stability/assembly factor-like uncharacterized protein